MFDASTILSCQTVVWYSELDPRYRALYLDRTVDEILARLAKELGRDGLPTALEEGDFDECAKTGNRLFRGVSQVEYVASYTKGPYRATSGLCGQGIYTLGCDDATWAMETARRYGDHVIDIALKPEAATVSINELEDRMDEFCVRLRETTAGAIAGATEGEAEDLLKRSQAANDLMSRTGFFAMATDIDAYFESRDTHKGVEMVYYIVLDRSATCVRRNQSD